MLLIKWLEVRPQINCAVCNTGDIHINGMEGSYSMIVIDGMPVMGGLASVYGLQGIPTSIIHQLEVVKGTFFHSIWLRSNGRIN